MTGGGMGVSDGRTASRVFEAIVHHVRREMAAGRLRPGDRLPTEREWAEKLAVSRTSVREAIRALEVVGLVRRRRRGGTYVNSVEFRHALLPLFFHLSSQHRFIRDVLELRRLLEPPICALAAERVTDEDLAELERIHRHLVDLAHRQGPVLEADADFHLAIARATKNAAVVGLVAVLDAVVRTWRQLLQESRVSGHLPSGREAILAALRRRDPELARAAMLLHIDEVAAVVHRFLAGEEAAADQQAGAGREALPADAGAAPPSFPPPA